MKKSAVIVSCNDNYDYDTRTKFVEHVLQSKGYDISYIVADFDHRHKTSYASIHDGKVVYVHVREYKKNLSFNRILSHIDFANGVSNYLKDKSVDIIYHCAPPNITIRALSKYKREHPKTQLITEIGDMWPESIPIPTILKKFLRVPFYIWSSIRDSNLDNSDIVITECNLFNKKISKNTKHPNVETLYFCKDAQYCNDKKQITNKIVLCYLGSINNIIDIELIGNLVMEISKSIKVDVEIIGDGENRTSLIDTIQINGGSANYHGIIFDDEEKQKIYSRCHFALNIMRKEVFVGMTMKSLDYVSYGLPLINSIGADIEEMVELYNIGYNLNKANISKIAYILSHISNEEYHTLVSNVKKVHNDFFSCESFYNRFNVLIDKKQNEKDFSI